VTVASIAGRSAATRRAVNAELTNRRRRVCCGGLAVSMLVNSIRSAGCSAQFGKPRNASISGGMWPRRGSRTIAAQSA
jgi:hypothetical protein